MDPLIPPAGGAPVTDSPAERQGMAGRDGIGEPYRAAIARYLLRLVGDGALAEDLTQETLLRAHRHGAELKDPGALESWLYRIATNLGYDALRQRQRAPTLLSLSSPGDEGQDPPLPDEARLQPDQLLEQNAMSACVGRFLAGLPEAERAVLVLHDLQGCTHPEITEQLGCSLATAKMRLHRARARLRETLVAACELSQDHRGVLVCHPKACG